LHDFEISLLSSDGQLHFELPETDGNRSFRLNELISSQDETILTTDQLKQLEKENIRKALKKTGYKIHGRGGSAELLQIRPTTLASKIKSMGIDMHD